jgi:hypothetical protein
MALSASAPCPAIEALAQAGLAGTGGRHAVIGALPEGVVGQGHGLGDRTAQRHLYQPGLGVIAELPVQRAGVGDGRGVAGTLIGIVGRRLAGLPTVTEVRLSHVVLMAAVYHLSRTPLACPDFGIHYSYLGAARFC